MEYFLDRSAAIEAKDRAGRASVHLAAAKSHHKTTMTLLRREADPFRKTVIEKFLLWTLQRPVRKLQYVADHPVARSARRWLV